MHLEKKAESQRKREGQVDLENTSFSYTPPAHYCYFISFVTRSRLTKAFINKTNDKFLLVLVDCDVCYHADQCDQRDSLEAGQASLEIAEKISKYFYVFKKIITF